MSRAAQELADKIRRLTQPAEITLDGEVTAVDESDYTCTVKLANGLELTPVQLKALKGASDTVVVVPQVGSDVQVINIGNPDWMVISCDVVDKVIIKAAVKVQIDCEDVVINGGSNNGLVIVGDLVQKLNAIEQDVNNLKTALQTALTTPASEPGNGASSVFQQVLNGAVASWYGQQLQTTQQSDLENTKVKH